MVNIDKLRGKIIEKRLTLDELAIAININRSTLYRKMEADGASFSIKEVDGIIKFLQLNKEEANSIFFAQFVA